MVKQLRELTGLGMMECKKALSETGGDATDLHLQAGSPVLGQGTLLAAVSTDIDLDLRDSAPDMGADEIVAGRSGTIPAGTYRDAFLNNGATLSGDASFSGNLTLGGVVNAGTSTMSIGCGASRSAPESRPISESFAHVSEPAWQ